VERLSALPAWPGTLQAALEFLGKSVLQVLSAPDGMNIVATSPILQDEADQLPPDPGSVLLLVTSRPTGSSALDAISAAGRNRYAAVVVKLRGHDPDLLIGAAKAAGIAVLVAAEELPWHRLLALLTTALGVTADEKKPALADGDMFSLANAIAAAVGGAVAIEDTAQDVVAYSSLPGQEIDDVRQQGILARHIPDLSKHAEQYREVYRADGVVRYPFDPWTGERPRAAIAVRAGAEVLGSIWVVEGSAPLRPDCERVLEDSARVTALYFLRARAASDVERHTQGELLRSLLQGHGSPALLAQQIGLRKNAPFIVLGFDFLEVGTPPQLRPRLIREIVNYVATFGEEVASAALKSSVYVVISPRNGAEIGSRIASGAAAQAETVLRHPVRAAISTVATDPAQAPALRGEVDEILRELTSDPAAPSVATAEQVRSRILLSRLSEVVAQDPRLGHPGVHALQSYDRRRGTHYGRSLLAYLEAMGDAAAAGGKLAVHRNTLRYRIGRAASLFNLDLEDPDERLLVWLQLRLALSDADRALAPDGGAAPPPSASSASAVI
jgi:PucR C-terminal helix-turn-helix domain/GGDEF-like domain